MIYNINKWIFHERPNRFIAIVEIDGNQKSAMLKIQEDKELLIKGVVVYVQEQAIQTERLGMI